MSNRKNKSMKTAGVAQAQQTLSDDKNRLENTKRKWRKTIIFLWILVVLSLDFSSYRRLEQSDG